MKPSAELSWAGVLGAGLVLSFVMAFVACVAFLALGGRLAAGGAAVPGLATAVGVAWALRSLRPQRPGWRGLFAVVVCVWIAAALVAAGVLDLSWDGQAYHQEAVLAFAGGWNPLRDGPLPLTARPDNLWIDTYPKAAWMVEALVVAASGALEAGKALSWVAALAAALLATEAARALGVSRRLAVAAGALAALNPVVTAQLYSFYVDGLLYAVLLAAVALVVLLVRAANSDAARPRQMLALVFGGALAFAVNLKFTGLIYASALAAVAWLLVRGRRAHRVLLVSSAVALAAATFVLGFDPYVTNTIRRGHPFSPLAGPGAVDIITPHVAAGFHTLPRPARLVLSTLASSSNLNQMPHLKAPWQVAPDELRSFAFADVRIGGFGPLWGGAVLLALLLLAAAPPPRRWSLALAASVGVAFANPGLWWARYVPQLWLAPLLIGALALRDRARLRRAGGWALLSVSAANALLVVGAAATQQIQASHRAWEQLASLATLQHTPWRAHWHGFEANARRLSEAGVAAVPGVAPCAHPVRLLGSQTDLCPDEPETPLVSR